MSPPSSPRETATSLRAVSGTSGDRTTSDDWTARHARTRGPSSGSNVRFEEPTDDRDEEWFRRHGRTRGR